jgi:hypothetical protein
VYIIVCKLHISDLPLLKYCKFLRRIISRNYRCAILYQIPVILKVTATKNTLLIYVELRFSLDITSYTSIIALTGQKYSWES